MNWNITTRSKMVTTRLGKLAVRVDGGADMAPLLLCQRFRGTIEDWDPEFIALLAVGRQVIRFDSTGVGESEGETPNAIAAMAEIVPALLDALKLDRTDLLGWSLGGYIAQTVALNWPQRVHRLVIAGSGPGGPDGPPPHPRVAEIAAKQVITQEDLSFLFFTDSEAGVAAAERHLTHIRVAEHAPVSAESGRQQREAVVAWWKGEGAARSRLTELSLPVLVANGVMDVMIPAEHSFAIARTAPNAKLVLYPDAGHAFLFQYAEEFSREVLAFLRI
jgi:pimeloyl-ACP methyl ester carboxylesterase